MNNPKPIVPQGRLAILTRRKFVGGALLAMAGASGLRAAGESPWQVGCYTRPWNKHDYRVALDAIAAAGFKFAGLMTAKTGMLLTPDTTLEQSAKMAAEAKTRGLSIASAFGADFMKKSSVAESIVRLRRLVDNVAACGCPGLLLGGAGYPEAVDDYYKVVAECCDYAEAKRVGLTIKPHNGPSSTGALCRRLIDQVGHKNFRLTYDPGNVCKHSGNTVNPTDDAATVDGIVAGMCVKDFRLPNDVEITPGTGQVDFARVTARLRRGGFTRGPVVIECLDAGDIAHVTAEAKKTRLFIEALLARGLT
ncbi:MAG: sugar phosphate isomerase/epimerase family protein [Opitutaceae bacterium]|nr:sugar phosphate isomerase/epimerase family protein [Opitutaceae bacterium]